MQHLLERPALRPGAVEKTLPDGGAEIATAHTIASR